MSYVFVIRLESVCTLSVLSIKHRAKHPTPSCASSLTGVELTASPASPPRNRHISIAKD